MNKAMLTVGVILLAVLSLLIINVVQGYSSGSELDYYLLKETTEAAMIDAVDDSYFGDNGVVRIDKEKFAESFLRRFAASIDQNRNYEVSMYDINEVPPKVSIRIISSTSSSFSGDNVDIVTNVDGILESNNKSDILVTKGLQEGTLGNGLVRLAKSSK